MTISSFRQRLDSLNPAFRTADRRLLLARTTWFFLAVILLGIVSYSLATQSVWIAPDLPTSELDALRQVGISSSDNGSRSKAAEQAW